MSQELNWRENEDISVKNQKRKNKMIIKKTLVEINRKKKCADSSKMANVGMEKMEKNLIN